MFSLILVVALVVVIWAIAPALCRGNQNQSSGSLSDEVYDDENYYYYEEEEDYDYVPGSGYDEYGTEEYLLEEFEEPEIHMEPSSETEELEMYEELEFYEEPGETVEDTDTSQPVPEYTGETDQELNVVDEPSVPVDEEEESCQEVHGTTYEIFMHDIDLDPGIYDIEIPDLKLDRKIIGGDSDD